MKFSESDINIFYAFIEVAKNNKSFSDISIKSISDQLGISRQAMYQSHFKSTDELLYSLYYYADNNIRQEIIKVVDECKDKNRNSFIDKLVNKILPIIYEKIDIFKVLYSEKVTSNWSHFMENQYSDLLEPLFRDKFHKGTLIPAKLQSKIVIHEFIGLISIWMNQDNPVEPEKFSPIVIFSLNNSASMLI